MRSAVQANAAAIAAWLVAALCFALYVRTLAPGLVFPVIDSHELTLNAVRLGVPHPSGYPLYTWLGWLFVQLIPLGDAAYRMNLMSAVLGAAGIGLLVPAGVRLGLRLVPAAVAALLLGLSPTFWSQAVMAETYAPNVCMLVLVVLVLLGWAERVRRGEDADRRFVLFALFFGLSLGTHLSNLLFAPTFGLFALATAPRLLRRPRLLLAALAAFALAAAQYAWLPLRGGVFDQYPNDAPVTLAGIYGYTFGAFRELKFTFPLAMQPFRLWYWLTLLAREFTLAGVALGALGMWVALFRDAARFWLLFGLLVTNAAVFTQFAAPDANVFFLSGWVAWVAFAGFGVQAVLAALARPLPARMAEVAVAGACAAGLVWIGRDAFRANDRSSETLVADFAPNAFAMMPPGSFVVGARGAFGADMVYWQVARGLRPDVVVLGQHDTPRGSPRPPKPPEAPLFTTVRVADGGPTPTGRLGHFPKTLPPDAWYVPVLLGNAYGLRLTRVQDAPPALAAPDAPHPRLDRRLGPATLVAAAAAVRPDAPSPRLGMESWWRVPPSARFTVSTRVGDRTLASHELGLGNLPRYAARVGLPDGSLVREAYDVVLPSTLPAGEHVVRLGVVDPSERELRLHWTDVGTIRIP